MWGHGARNHNQHYRFNPFGVSILSFRAQTQNGDPNERGEHINIPREGPKGPSTREWKLYIAEFDEKSSSVDR